MKKKIIIAVLGVFGLLCLAWFIPFVYMIFASSSSLIAGPVDAACKLARLASLPTGSQIVNTQDTENPFSASYRFIFKSDKDAIEKWLEFSPGIQEAKVTEYNEGLVLTPVTGLPEPMEDGVEYLFIPKNAPWFAPAITNGRKYEIPQDENADYGTVYVNNDTWTVYVTASHS